MRRPFEGLGLRVGDVVAILAAVAVVNVGAFVLFNTPVKSATVVGTTVGMLWFTRRRRRNARMDNDG